MKATILEFIRSQRVGVLAVEMLDGSPHGAAVHFAHTEDPFTFIFETDKRYRKFEPLSGRKESRASLVVGFEEGKASKTFQTDGIAQLLRDSEKELVELYLNKFPEKREKLAQNPHAVFFKFTPTWWRFTDWSGPNGKIILTSTDET